MAEFPTSFADDFVQLPDSSYLVYSRFSRVARRLPADWSEFSDFIEYEFENFFSANNGHQLLEDGSWLLSGVGCLEDPITQDEISASQAIILHPDTTIEVIYQNIPPDSVSMIRGFHVMDMVDTSNIYFSNGYASTSLSHPNDSSFGYVSIHSIQLNGTENWTQYLGFEAAYHPIKILATQDEGVLLLVYRYSETENEKGEGDMYFIKLDKDGNVDFTVGTDDEESPIIKQQFLVFPNPAQDILNYTFSGQNINAPIIKIFDSAGRLLMTDEISDKETDISVLVPGYFFYEILDENKRVQTGKLLKE